MAKKKNTPAVQEPPAFNVEVKPVSIPVVDPVITVAPGATVVSVGQAEPIKRYDYKFLYATGANTFGLKWEEAFDALGREGWLFIGESVGRSVFVKPLS